MKFGMIRGICAQQMASYFGELCPIFPGAQIFSSRYMGHFCRVATKFGMVRDMANGHMFPKLWRTFAGAKILTADISDIFVEAQPNFASWGH